MEGPLYLFLRNLIGQTVTAMVQILHFVGSFQMGGGLRIACGGKPL